jgi:PAS domain S-box-containing protein
MATDDIIVHHTDPAVSELQYFPAYARFLLDNRLPEFAATLLRLSRELDIPLLRYFEGFPEEQLIALGMEGNKRLLSAIADNNLADYIAESLRNWKENQLPLIQNDDVVIEDISKVNYSRRKVFRDFLPLYTRDIDTFSRVMEEVDRFTLVQEEVSYKTLFEIKEGKIRENHHFINKINNTSPGIIYVYDLQSLKQIYSNHKREEVLGYTDEEMQSIGEDSIDAIIHPDDRKVVSLHVKEFSSVPDGEVKIVEYRIRNKMGRYVWQRSYETVFKRNNYGKPTEVIGISIDITREREAASLLEQREQQLREAQEIAGMGSFEWNLVGDTSVFSPYLFEIFEMEESSNLPDFLQFVHPYDRESVKSAIADALQGNTDYECEYRYRKNGPEKVIWSRGKVVFEGGRAVKMKGTVMDVTQRHDMLKRLARSEQLHKQAQALTHLGNWSWSLADDKVEWSDEMYRIFGLEPQSEEMSLGRILSLLHPDDRESRRLALHTAVDNLWTEDYVMRVLGPNNTTGYIEGKSEVLSDEKGKPYKIIGTCQDITRQYLLNERLKENEEASRQLIQSAPEGIIVINEKSNILLWNPRATDIFGWTEEEIKGKTLMETIIPPGYRLGHVSGMNRFDLTGETHILNQTIEVEALKKSGEQFYISLTVSRSVRGGMPVFIAFVRDISDERAVAQKLEEHRNQLAIKNRDLERRNEELMAFNYIASHDLKEPVRKIKLFSNLIGGQDRAHWSPQVTDYINRISSAADHMERLIDALILFSRTSNADRTFESVDLNVLIAEVRFSLLDQVEELNAVIDAGPLPQVRAIPFQVRQLFENLIGNALKYRKTGVPPVVQVGADLVPGFSINEPGSNPEAMYHRISVADNGIGFDQQYAPKVFEVFQRLHTKEAYSGTGIGLAICKKIVQQHDGFITAHSNPGEGTTFYVYFPVSDGD